MENKEEKKNWRLYAGLGGGFGGAKYMETINSTEHRAEVEAYRLAIEEYESCEGSHGLFNYDDFREEDPELTDEDLDEMYKNDIEDWIDYYVIEETEENKNED